MSPHPVIIDRGLLRRRQRRALAGDTPAFLIERVADDLKERLAVVLRHFEVAADLGTPTPHLKDVLAQSGKVEAIIAANAFLAYGLDFPRPMVRNVQQLAVAADEESLPFRDQSLDLIVSGLALQFVNDLPGTLIQARRALKPDGLFLAALLGGDTLTELRQAFAVAEAELENGLSPRVMPFADLRDVGGLLQRAGFALPVVDSDRISVRYESARALLTDLRRMGAANALVERRRWPIRRRTFNRMLEVYGTQHSDSDGRIRATFEIIWLSGWAPHASQQKPLAPGSADVRLADALGAIRATRREEE